VTSPCSTTVSTAHYHSHFSTIPHLHPSSNMSSPGQIDQESILFSITTSPSDPMTATGSIQWHVDYTTSPSDPNPSSSDSAKIMGIQLHRRRQPLEIENTTTEISTFERRWRELSLLAEEWTWLNGSGPPSFPSTSPPSPFHHSSIRSTDLTVQSVSNLPSTKSRW
jgi:hypothetical protein